jgi:prepilin-type N-terminal cleavage/methylation domain-containing protein
MFTVQGKRKSLRIGGFTLLEIMLAVGILGLMSLAIFRFVQSTMTALRLSSDIAARDLQRRTWTPYALCAR